MIALGIPEALNNHLLGRLGQDATEAGGIHLHTDIVAHLGLGIVFSASHRQRDLALGIVHVLDDLHELKELDLAEFLAVAGFDLFFLAVPLACGLDHGFLESADNLARIDPFIFRNLINFTLQSRDEHACSSQSLNPESLSGSLAAPLQAEPSI